jgi:predicted AlkP superfamily pyrophosphatase or phosphodiesterase
MRKILIGIILLGAVSVFAQGQKPKLVVGIVVDQMRNDYISKYWNKYGEGGFKKLVSNGFYCKNTHYNYVPTYTGPGHASIYTGTTPAVHSIISNNWYDKYTKEMVYCTQDDSVVTLGADNNSGKMSPSRMKASTITDELKLSTNMEAKVIAVSLKDRGAILPGGHAADGAYWFDGNSGKWVSSTYYMNKLPGWVDGVNKANAAEPLIMAGWNTLLPIAEYTESFADDNAFEGLFEGETNPVFPHDLTKSFEVDKFGVIKSTPFGNTITRMFAESAIENEKMGMDNVTDFLALSFSATDYVGHMYGPQSVELEDTYLRLDKDIESFMKFLDAKIGKENYTIFLTADHGAVEVPSYLLHQKQVAGYIKTTGLKEILNDEFSMVYGEGKWIENYSNGQFFYTEDLKKKSVDEVYGVAERFLLKMDGISNVYSKEQVIIGNQEGSIFKSVQLGYNQKASGDLMFLLEPGWIIEHYGQTGTTHGSPYNYDSHVPLLWYGKGISQGETVDRVDITDIAVTLSMLLDINIPNGSIGTPIIELFERK